VPSASGPPGQAEARQAELTTETLTFPGQAGEMTAFAARPAGEGPFPGLIVIHENRGLTEHIRDVAQRFAAQGYAALAPDMLSRAGGKEQYPSDDAAVAAIGDLSQEGVMEDLRSSFDYLASQPYVISGSVGVIGYCWGGGNSLLMGTRVPELAAVVVYYGPNPADLDSVANISGPVLGIYGEEDPRITVNVPELDAAMQENGKTFEHEVYAGAAHAFFNDTGQRYHEESARDAWTLTLAFLQQNLKD
jgi:carboxymethylenebutenolidase